MRFREFGVSRSVFNDLLNGFVRFVSIHAVPSDCSFEARKPGGLLRVKYHKRGVAKMRRDGRREAESLDGK